VALPTETVYGLAGDALNAAAAARIFEAKQRPFFDPLICHVPDAGWLDRMTRIPEGSRRLVEELVRRFWPGPLTLVLPRRSTVPDLVSAGLSTVAVRQSAHPLFCRVVEQMGGPLAAPSANRFGRISPTCAADVVTELGGKIPLVLDGGPALHGVESTIVAVDPDVDRMRVLRSGPITREQLEPFGEVELVRKTVLEHPEAPGQLKSHYAPRTPTVLGSGGEGAFEKEPKRCGLLAWRVAAPGFERSEVLSHAGDFREAAAGLFTKLRRLDEAGLDQIVVELVPEQGLGLAINDRLRKACGAE
jgi:L-threonylcarbamoyladenylate synthase